MFESFYAYKSVTFVLMLKPQLVYRAVYSSSSLKVRIIFYLVVLA